MDCMAKSSTGFTRKFACLCRGMQQRQVAEKIGATPQMVNAYLRDENPSIPSGAMMLQIARAFNVPVEWLIDDGIDVSTIPSHASFVSNGEMVSWLAEEYIHVEERLNKVLNRAETIPWDRIKLFHDYPDEGQSQADKAAHLVARELFFIVRQTIDKYDSVRYACDQSTAMHDLPIGNGSHDRRDHFIKRIDAIFNKLSSDNPAALMDFLRGQAWSLETPDDTFAMVHKAIGAYFKAAAK